MLHLVRHMDIALFHSGNLVVKFPALQHIHLSIHLKQEVSIIYLGFRSS